jgi:hypothetical protein
VAKLSCEEMGGALAWVPDADTNAWIHQVRTTLGLDQERVWMGLSDEDAEMPVPARDGDWRYGAPGWRSLDWVEPSYRNWAVNQPDNGLGWVEEDCAAFRANGATWLDTSCEDRYAYVCTLW